MLIEEKGAEEIVDRFKTVIKKERCKKRKTGLDRIVPENKARFEQEKEISKPTIKSKKKKATKDEHKKKMGKETGAGKTKVKTKGKPKVRHSKNKRKRDQDDYERYYDGVRKKFGWGVDADKLTKEQLHERAKLKHKSFKKNTCPLCKSRFRMRSRLKEHIKKHNCSCKHCGLIYESAFQRSDHRWSCNVRRRTGIIKKEKYPSNVNTALISPLWARSSAFSTPRQMEAPTRPSTLALGIIPESFRSDSNFVLPSLALDFWPSKIKQPLCPVENRKFNAKLQLDEPSEPALGFQNVGAQPPNTLDREIKSLLVSDQLDIIVDF